MSTPKLRKMLLHLAEATLARYERVAERGRAHPPDFNALMMRICANIVEERKASNAGLDDLVDAMTPQPGDPPFSDAPIRRSRRGQR